MLRLGSHWLKSQSLYDKQSSQVSGGYSWPDNYPPELNVIYPFTGRIWVLTVRSGESGPADWARVRMAFTMDERCAILEEMRAKLYTLVDIFQDIAKSLEDGAAIGRRW